MPIGALRNFSGLTLQQRLASDATADEGDVLAVKQRLNALGHYEIPSYGMTQYPDHRLFDGIRSFQRDHNLIVDGYMKPGGETEAALNQILAPRLAKFFGPPLERKPQPKPVLKRQFYNGGGRRG